MGVYYMGVEFRVLLEWENLILGLLRGLLLLAGLVACCLCCFLVFKWLLAVMDELAQLLIHDF